MMPQRLRRPVVTAVLALLVMGGACGDSGEGDASTIDDLDAALQAAAQALLDTLGVRAASLSYGKDGSVLVTRWSDSRPNGDFAVVTVVEDEAGLAETGAIIQVGGDVFTAISTVDGGEPWSAISASAPPPGTLPIGFDLGGVANGQVVATAVSGVTGEVGVSTVPGATGGAVWSVTGLGGDGATTLRWETDGDGFLRSLTISASGGFVPVPPYARLRYTFDPVAEPSPIAPPEIGSTLDVDSLGFPTDLERPG